MAGMVFLNNSIQIDLFAYKSQNQHIKKYSMVKI